MNKKTALLLIGLMISASFLNGTPSTNSAGGSSLTVSTTNVNLIIIKDSASLSGLTMTDAFTIANSGSLATGWQLYNNQNATFTSPSGSPVSTNAQGFGFYESSGGISAGQTVAIRAYLNNNKEPGIYKGSYKLQEIKNGAITDVAIISYSLNFNTAPSIIVLSPNGGEQWIIGNTYNITWTSQGNFPNGVGIALTKSGQYVKNLILGDPNSNTPNTGSASWTLDSSLTQGSDYKIRITDPITSAYNESNNYFSIVSANTAPSIIVLSPNGGEAWVAGAFHNISWISSGISSIKVYLLWYEDNNSPSSSEIATINMLSRPNGGEINWTIPQNQTPRSNYRIQVSDGSKTTISALGVDYDVSDNYFSIVPAGAPFIHLTFPNGGEKLLIGSTYNIVWVGQNITSGGYGVNLLKPDGSLYDHLVIDNQKTNVNFPFPSTIPAGQYKIEVYSPRPGVSPTDPNYKLASDTSDNVFNIINANTPAITSLSVLSPNGGEKWEIGKQYEIKWNSSNVSQVTIALTKSGQYIKNLLWNIASNGSAFWTPDLSLIPGDDYKIRITYPTDSDVYDESNNYFSIVKKEAAPNACLPDGALVKLPDDPKVYEIVNCQKKWIQTAEQFKKEGYKWSDVKETSSPVLQAYQNYIQATANLLRAIGQEKVYKVVNDKLLWVPTISAFNAQGLKWSDIQNVNELEINKYPRAKLLQTAGDEKVYYITESGMKRYIPNEQVFNSYNNKRQDIIQVSTAELNAYPDNNLIKKEGDYKVYKLENGAKKWIKTADAFKKNKFDWNKIVPINTAEFSAYPEGASIE